VASFDDLSPVQIQTHPTLMATDNAIPTVDNLGLEAVTYQHDAQDVANMSSQAPSSHILF